MYFSEYRLSEEANPDRAMLLGFELLLARVECSHLLELLEKDQLGPQVTFKEASLRGLLFHFPHPGLFCQSGD